MPCDLDTLPLEMWLHIFREGRLSLEEIGRLGMTCRSGVVLIRSQPVNALANSRMWKAVRHECWLNVRRTYSRISFEPHPLVVREPTTHRAPTLFSFSELDLHLPLALGGTQGGPNPQGLEGAEFFFSDRQIAPYYQGAQPELKELLPKAPDL